LRSKIKNHRFLPIYRRFIEEHLSPISGDLPGRFISKIDRLPAESGRFGPSPDPPLRPADLSAKAANYRSSPADFFPVAADSVRRPPRLRARPIYRQNRPITGRFLPRRRRIALSRTAFGSSLNRTEWGTTNTVFSRVGETEYHIHE
jgi:hypothetical protein